MKPDMKNREYRGKSPEESVAEPTWTIRLSEDDHDLRKFVALAMRISGMSRQEIILSVVKDHIRATVEQMLITKEREIVAVKATLDQLRPASVKRESTAANQTL